MVQLLLLEPALIPAAEGLEPEQFSSPPMAEVYGLLRRRYREGRAVQLAALAGELSPEVMSLLAELIEQPADLSNGRQALKDYMEIIETEALKRGGENADPLLAARDKFRERKSYGGHPHD